jgi:hypothetical protein
MTDAQLRFYIAGPMRGRKYYNFPAFDAAKAKIRRLGHIAISPADIDRENGFDPFELPPDHDWNTIPESLKLHDLIRRDIEAILSCDVILQLDGWSDSTGACAETAVARWAGLTAIEECYLNTSWMLDVRPELEALAKKIKFETSSTLAGRCPYSFGQ